MLAQLATLAVEYGAGDAMAALAPIELGQRTASFGFVVDVGQSFGFYTLATDGILGSSTGVAYGNLAPIPLPAGGLLLVGALGGLAALRRRKTT